MRDLLRPWCDECQALYSRWCIKVGYDNLGLAAAVPTVPACLVLKGSGGASVLLLSQQACLSDAGTGQNLLKPGSLLDFCWKACQVSARVFFKPQSPTRHAQRSAEPSEAEAPIYRRSLAVAVLLAAQMNLNSMPIYCVWY